jgi:hypothetical protein
MGASVGSDRGSRRYGRGCRPLACEWQRMDDKKACRIAVYRTDLDPRDEGQRPVQYAWLLDHMGRFAQVFGNRIGALPLDNAGEPEGLSVAAEG